MKFVSLVVMSALWCLILAGGGRAADISRLEWGSFVVEDDSSDGWSNYKFLSSDDGKSITMTFAPLEAKADGATLEARTKLAGHYDVIQPKADNFTGYIVAIEGHVIKSGASTTRLTLNIGDTEKIIEWTGGASNSEKFSRKIEIALPTEGRLPSPFKVSVEAFAHKGGPADAAYVSVDSLTITAANPQVAAN